MPRRGATHLFGRIDSLSYGVILGLWAINILVFAMLYTFAAQFPGNGPVASYDLHPTRNFLSIVYFSIITATGTGYGDIIPMGYARILAALESFSGLILLAIFVSKFLSRRQDIALAEVHKLSFQTEFHNVREDLYIARKDLDHGINAARERHMLDEPEWEQMCIAFQQISHLLHEIPSFYETENELYTIDSRREQLLLEAVQRTFNRVEKFIAMLLKEHIAFDDKKTVSELRHMLSTAEKILPQWDKHSPREQKATLDEIHETVNRIRTAYE